MADGCTVPPLGWSCSRSSGHVGPCAATPVLPAEALDVDRLIAAVTNASNTEQWGIYRKDGGPVLWTDRRQAARAIAREFDALAPSVGGHPEMPLHPFEDSGTGTCLACERHGDQDHGAASVAHDIRLASMSDE